MSSVTNDGVPIVESSVAIVDEPTPTNHGQSVPIALPSPSIGLFSLIFGPVQRPMASLRDLWSNYYPLYNHLGEETSLMPGSALNLIVFGLLGLVEIKSQGNNEFPFETNPRTMRFAINSLIMYAVASAAEHFFSVGRPAPTSVYTIAARLGRMLSLNQGAKDSYMTPPTTTTTLCAAE